MFRELILILTAAVLATTVLTVIAGSVAAEMRDRIAQEVARCR